MSIVIAVALGVYGLFFTGAACMKLIRHPHMIEEFQKMALPYWLAFVSGAVEIVFGPALIAGIWFPPAAGLAAIVMVPVMAGAAVVNYIGRDIQHAIGVIIVFLLPMAGIAWCHIEHIERMLPL